MVTVPLFPASVCQLLPDCPLEEALAALTAVDTVVFARGPVTTNTAEMLGPA